MKTRTLARDELWELAADQHGLFTAQQAINHGVTREALKKLAQRGTVGRAAFGVYHFKKFPYSDRARYMLAVLWTRAPEAVLSHETALECYQVSDLISDKIHVTVRKDRRLRRTGGERYEIHYEDLTPKQVGWWEQVPAVTVAAAITQCIDYGTPTYLLRQALERSQQTGWITARQQDELTTMLEARNDG